MTESTAQSARPMPAVALVTGGAGFVGHGVVAALSRAGVRVRVLDPAAPHPLWSTGVDHHRRRLGDPGALRDAAQGVDLIVHVAGIWDGRPGGDARMWALNVDGTRAVLALGVPTVYTSSSITCGFGPLNAPGTEQDPSEDPRRPIRGTPRVYRQTKLAAEDLVSEAGGFIVNPDYVVGAGDVTGVVTGPLLRAAKLPILPVPPGGKCFVGVGDVGDAHLAVWRFGRPARRYLAGAENRTYADIIGTLSRLMGRRACMIHLPASAHRIVRRVPGLAPTAGALEQMSLARYRTNARACAELRWRPHPVDDALARLVHFSER